MRNKNFILLVLAGLLCAIGLLVPMFMPKLVLGPMSFTIASHVAIFLAMFITPALALAVCIGTTLGFFITTPFIIALRAASHIVFAIIGAFVIKKFPHVIESTVPAMILNIFLSFIHAVSEVAVVSPFFFAGEMFNSEQLTAGFVSSVLILIGGGTFIHSIIDCIIALCVWKPLHSAVPLIDTVRKCV